MSARRNVLRTVTAATVLAGAALSSLPANAGNSDPNAPNAQTRAVFCGAPQFWKPGVRIEGTSNDGRYGTWVITNVVDDPHQTRFDAAFYSNITSWVSFYCI